MIFFEENFKLMLPHKQPCMYMHVLMNINPTITVTTAAL